VLTRITLVGSLYLAAVTILPEFLLDRRQGRRIPASAALDASSRLVHPGLGHQLLLRRHLAADRRRRGDGLLQQVESQLVMRNYEGFMKRGRIRGRRG
jgi:preprotein translocase subunit SecY